MRGVLVIIDGMADSQSSQLGGKTPLESADMPNLNFLAARGELGYMYPVKPGFIPESDEAILSIFGNDLSSSTRGQLEAAGTDLKLTRGDLALRANFATIDSLEKRNILDRRGGRTLTTAEAIELCSDINKQVKLSCEFTLKPTIQHRAVLVFRGGFSDNISGNDLIYSQGRTRITDKLTACKPLDEEDNSQYTANVVNEFLEKAHEILDNHPINKKRKERGLLPANFLLVRGAGIEPPKLNHYKDWISVVYMPLEIGFSRQSGMKMVSFNYPKLKNMDVYSNLYSGLAEACKLAIKTIKKNQRKTDYVYIHLKETDIPGHDNKPLEKKAMLEYIDKTFFRFLRKFAPPNKIKVVVTADHTTSCNAKTHTAEPVPVLFYNNGIPKEKNFTEKEAKKGSLGGFIGMELLEKVDFGK